MRPRVDVVEVRDSAVVILTVWDISNILGRQGC